MLKFYSSVQGIVYVYRLICIFLFSSICQCWGSIDTNVEVLRPRGVPLSKKIFYEPRKDFNCMDGTGIIPFQFVNDDYCDCIDGSDEPGTSACTNALFHCVNSGYFSKDIPSSRVNDGVCDCCDGSDEYGSNADCMNMCLEYGRHAREEAERQRDLFEKGYAFYQDYVTRGKQIKEDNLVKLQTFKSSESDAEKIKNEKEAIKNEAEAKEKSALEKYEIVKEAEKKETEELEMQQHQEKEKQNAEIAFKELDINQDGMLTYDEIQQFPKFDSNHDGVVSEEEGKFFLHMKNSMEFEEFVTTGWMIMKPIYYLDKVTESMVVSTTEEAITDNTAGEIENHPSDFSEPEAEAIAFEQEDYLQDEDLAEEEFAEDPSPLPPKEVPEQESAEKKDEVQYDPETQQLVNEANEARKIYKDALDSLESIRNEIRQTEKDVTGDFGPHQEFAPLKGQCFDFNDHEYTYRLCPFDRASQIPKSGGSDISLGKWGHWAGPGDNKYIKMQYENGQGCWNGPSRSVMVLLHCGLEDKVLSSSEPNRCEYLFEFSTPALCSTSQQSERVHQHTEL